MSIKLFLAGDVMTGRGIDQILRHPGDPTLYETWAKSAIDYVHLAERANGPIPRQVGSSYIWGEALTKLDDWGVDARVINLETAVTVNDEPWPHKGINYRMHPANVACITSAKIKACSLANNHVLDWSHDGLAETLTTLTSSGLATTGAGHDSESAWDPAIVEVEPGSRIMIFGFGRTSSGIHPAWRAGPASPGVAIAEGRTSETVDRVSEKLGTRIREHDLVIASIHWGQNWGYEIPSRHRELAHALIDGARVDVVHGHSSHHPLGIEVYRGKPILYGCGDLINDYEGIRGHEEYRPDLRALYLLTIDSSTRDLEHLEIVAMRAERFRLVIADRDEAAWLGQKLHDEGEGFGTVVDSGAHGRLVIRW